MKKKFAEAQIAVSTILSTPFVGELATHSSCINYEGSPAAF
jgi:hypothetical protein